MTERKRKKLMHLGGMEGGKERREGKAFGQPSDLSCTLNIPVKANPILSGHLLLSEHQPLGSLIFFTRIYCKTMKPVFSGPL